MYPATCIAVVRDGVSFQTKIRVLIQCKKLIGQTIGTDDFHFPEHYDIIVYCYAVHFGIVNNGTVEDVNFGTLNQKINGYQKLTTDQRSMLLDRQASPCCTNLINCFLQPCNITINQLGRLVPVEQE